MNVTTEHANGIAIVRVGESRLMYPLLSEFSSAVTQLLAAGEKRVVVDLSSVGYVDSATIGCLMDLYRQAEAGGGTLKLAGAQKRVETMLTMTGAQNFLEVHADQGTAVELDGDVLAILETISRDLARRLQLEYSFEDVDHEFQHLIGQMDADE